MQRIFLELTSEEYERVKVGEACRQALHALAGALLSAFSDETHPVKPGEKLNLLNNDKLNEALNLAFQVTGGAVKQ
nr:MAG TPA: hypothetical protein [Caudoviricetes sp.]